MDALISGQLRVERGRQEPSLPGHDDTVAVDGEHFDRRPGRLDPRSTNEDAGNGFRSEDFDVERGFEAVHLASERIAPCNDVH